MSEYLTGNFTMSAYFAGDVISHPPNTVRGDWDGLPAHGNAMFAMGLQRTVHLNYVNAVRLTEYVRTESIQSDGSALLAISGAVENDSEEPTAAKVDLSVNPSTSTGETQRLKPISVEATPGVTAFSSKVVVKDAHLWWTWDQGAQDLYRPKASIDSATKSGDHQTVSSGLF